MNNTVGEEKRAEKALEFGEMLKSGQGLKLLCGMSD